ncbi:Scr1 family TA system antitoxin-like transcriptional regulator [Nonomuraea diastatica]|uniref:Scr1 family TA system antitoxin-like transcriptional regulator n=1 Tax=Nonomuraea diastatica TaxID=1848329 RepID=UPI00248307B6|nr:Scr1 family TA system antitoxin-like transcriptional regulator [Nonomuraea diastatica]
MMREQLGHLLEMAERPAVFVQIVDPECVAGLAEAFMIAELLKIEEARREWT